MDDKRGPVSRVPTLDESALAGQKLVFHPLDFYIDTALVMQLAPVHIGTVFTIQCSPVHVDTVFTSKLLCV